MMDREIWLEEIMVVCMYDGFDFLGGLHFSVWLSFIYVGWDWGCTGSS